MSTKTKKSQKPINKRRSKKRSAVLGFSAKSLKRPKRDAALFSVVFIVALVWALAVEQLAPRTTTQAATNSVESVSTDYKNLDLSLAAKSYYNNSALRVVKNLGVSDGVERSIVSFGVPKDGLFEYAFMAKPSAPTADGKYPVIILCHGFADPRTYSTANTYDDDMLFYAQHGFLVVKPDLRGQGLSLSKGTPDGAYFSMGYNTDVMSLIAALKKTTYASSNSLNLWGHSMGGYIAMRAAVLSPDVKSVVLLAPPGDIVEQARHSYIAPSDRDNPIAASVRSQQLALHGDPLTNVQFWEKTSPLTYLQNSSAFFQIHVGSADGVVPPLFSANLEEKLSELGINHEYYVYPGSGHALILDRQAIWQRSLQVLASGK